MPFMQSAAFTMAVHQGTRGITKMVMRGLGKSEQDADLIASEASIKVASAAGSAAAVITADPLGAAASATYLTCAISEHDAMLRDKKNR